MLYHIRAGEVPHLIKKTAKALCGEFYEMTRTDQFRAMHQDQKFRKATRQREFVRDNWHLYVEPSISCLCDLLKVESFPQDQKDQIEDALFEFTKRGSIGIPPPSLRVFQ